MNPTLRRYGIYLILVLILLLSGVTAVKVIFFPAAEEILYDAQMIHGGQLSTEKTKPRRPGKTLHLYELKIGNTGKRDQPLVEVHLPPDENLKIMAVKVRFIAASNKKVSKSMIDHEWTDDSLIYKIAPLPANRMVIMKMYALTMRGENIFEDPIFKIKAKGRVEEADPEMTTLARFFRALFALL
jgi:hypothetical protein